MAKARPTLARTPRRSAAEAVAAAGRAVVIDRQRYTRSSADNKEARWSVPLFMDTHERVRALTMAGVTRAYEQSLETQGRHGARYLKMWVHQGADDHGRMYCLIDAPSREAVVLVHLD